jgi:hypothetical protein
MQSTLPSNMCALEDEVFYSANLSSSSWSWGSLIQPGLTLALGIAWYFAYRHAYQTGLEAGEKKGFAEGIQRGRTEGIDHERNECATELTSRSQALSREANSLPQDTPADRLLKELTDQLSKVEGSSITLSAAFLKRNNFKINVEIVSDEVTLTHTIDATFRLNLSARAMIKNGDFFSGIPFTVKEATKLKEQLAAGQNKREARRVEILARSNETLRNACILQITPPPAPVRLAQDYIP